MERWRFFGPEHELTPIARLIMAEDIAGLDATLGGEWQLNRMFVFCRHCEDLAINLALIENKQQVIDYLIDKGADLNVKGSPAITFAAHNSDTRAIQKLLDAGARIDAANNVGSNAYSCALYSDRIDLLPFLLSKGLRVDADGGKSFRQAVYSRKREAVEFFLKAGIDPNLRRADQVHPSNPTAVLVAAENDDFDMVRLLVDHGADVTLQDDNGERPFFAAAFNKNIPMQKYLRALEPDSLHDPERKIDLLKSYGVTQDLIEFLQREDRRIHVNSGDCKWLDFHDLLSIREMNYDGDLYLVLFPAVDDCCPCWPLAWSKHSNCLVMINRDDVQETIIGSWADFVAAPVSYIPTQWN
jgi:uncharacterized protein